MPLTVMKELGRGGFGIVDQVKDSKGKVFARKTFAPASHIDRASYPNLRQRFKREVKTQQAIGGREILPVIDANLDIDEPWFTMPLADAIYEDKMQSDKQSGHLDIRPVADILNGLVYLHDMGYVHRDLNPKNVVLHEGVWKLSDLGSVLPPSNKTVTLTEDTLIYTEQYCSPEQRVKFHAAQPSSDIYSFGCILHDFYGKTPRTPFATHKAKAGAPGSIGILIEKCTDQNPTRRPKVHPLRDMVLDALVSAEGFYNVDDKQSGEWLTKLMDTSEWSDSDVMDFSQFFDELDISERVSGLGSPWLHATSTLFITRFPLEAMRALVSRQDGCSGAIVEKYCGWAAQTDFEFEFSDIISSRLTSIFDLGTPADKGKAIVALIKLAANHNRWHIMRELLRRCGTDLPREVAKRIYIDIKSEEVVPEFLSCVEGVGWDKSQLAAEIGKLSV